MYGAVISLKNYTIYKWVLVLKQCNKIPIKEHLKKVRKLIKNSCLLYVKRLLYKYKGITNI